MTDVRLPEWLRPPVGGRVAEDLDRIAGLPRHTELIDGNLVFAGPRTIRWALTVDGLFRQLSSQAPDGLVVLAGMTMTLGRRQRPEPDLSVVTRAAIRDLEQTDIPVREALLVSEVVSPSSEVIDRERKPQLYAAAGIPDYWLVEEEDGAPAVHAHELGPDRAYHLAAVHRGRLKTSRPFPIDVDLTGLTRL